MQKSSLIFTRQKSLYYHFTILNFYIVKPQNILSPETRNVYNGKSSDSTSSAEIPSRGFPQWYYFLVHFTVEVTVSDLHGFPF